jgi:internalin A
VISIQKKMTRPEKTVWDDIVRKIISNGMDLGLEERLEIYGINKFLDLNNLGLSEIPKEVRTFHDVEYLFIMFNNIRELPSWINELKSLKVIAIDNNKLKTLPAEIGSLRKLRILSLSNNNLETLPETLIQLNISYLDLSNNPGLRIPESLASGPSEEILRYYFESRNEKGRPLLELKLLLVGRGKAGKTTLVKQLAGEMPLENEPETHSIAIRELNFNFSRGQVRTRAWDFGGQEILHSTHQFFLTERSLYLLVLEHRTGSAQRDAEYWLKLIETEGNKSPVIIVLNYSHNHTWQVDRIKLKRKYPFIVDFVSTDALYGDGIEELRHVILKTIDEQMQDVWLPFPERWRRIKDAVAGMHENFLTFSRYAKLCENFGETDKDAQADLAGILHSLGLALYFGKDRRLHDTRVLNPGWVTGGVYAVIRAPSVAKNDGQLSVDDMPLVLREAEEQNVINASEYPIETHRFILDLMRAFQLCYGSDDVDCEKAGPYIIEDEEKPVRYLVPELLPEFEPEMIDEWDKAPVHLRYRYDVLLPGLLPRFIVRTHVLSEGAPHWRHGVVLSHAEAKALIRAESDRQELHIFVLGGDAETQQMLAAMVRRELELLHADMKIQPVEEIELTGEGERWISVKSLSEIEHPERPTQKLPIQPEGTADVNVSDELNKLVPPEARAIARNQDSAPVPVRLFVSYAHDDKRQLKRLDLTLDILEKQQGLTSWLDQRLIAGEEWDEEIRRRLEEMDIFLFIASQTSLVRPYITDPELKRAKERYENGEIDIVTVKLEPCACDDDIFLGKLQRLAPRFKSVTETSPRSMAWEQVRKDLLPVIKRVRTKKSGPGL